MRTLGDRIGTGLQQFYQYVNSHISTAEQPDGRRWSGFILDIPKSKQVNSLGIGATALGLSVYALAPSPDHLRTEEMARFIASAQDANGSWTISALRRFNVPLVYTTCYALQALTRHGASAFHGHVQKGLDWLLGVVNQDGGWSLAGTGGSHVHATAEAVYTLFLIGSGVPRDTLSRGQRWLLEHRVGPFWCDEHGAASTFLTALAYRALVPNGALRFQLRETREWLIRRLRTSPCREEVSYHIPIDGQFLRETISCYTRATAFEALTTDPFLENDPRLDAEAAMLLRRQGRLGAWTCPDSGVVPMYLNCAVYIALRNHRENVEQRPRWPLGRDLAAAFRRHTGFSVIVTALSTVGLAETLQNASAVGGWLRSTVSDLNESLTRISGIANLFQILGIGIVGIVWATTRWIMKRRGRI